jgi:large subunit ribosomal protein L47
VLRSHIKNWKSLNLKQRKIILGFLNARRSKDAKAAFLKELKILGDKIAQDQLKERIGNVENKPE